MKKQRPANQDFFKEPNEDPQIDPDLINNKLLTSTVRQESGTSIQVPPPR